MRLGEGAQAKFELKGAVWQEDWGERCWRSVGVRRNKQSAIRLLDLAMEYHFT